MRERMKIGIIGTDTSHCIAFTELLNDQEHLHHVSKGQVVAAFPCGSPDFELSISRVAGFVEQLESRFAVRILDSAEQIAEASDAILLLCADGRVHREVFEKLAPYGKPIFIDKPIANTIADAEAIAKLAIEWNVPVMSSSALRYAEALTVNLQNNDDGEIIGVDCYGPLNMEITQKGYFWYGIHSVEMLFAAMGGGCAEVTATTTGDQETIIGKWKDGRVGTVRGSRNIWHPFTATIHRERNSAFVEVNSSAKPFYASLLDQVMNMFETGKPTVEMEITLEIVRFIEAANESRKIGKTVYL